MLRLFVRVFCVLLVIASNPVLASDPIKVLLLGDSIASGYGLQLDDGFASQLDEQLYARGIVVEITNQAFAGATTQSALSRIDDATSVEHDIVIIVLGANDILRGIDPMVTRSNLETIAESFAQPIFLVGMRAPAQYGRRYVEAFDPIYDEIAREHGYGLYPFVFAPIIAKDPTARATLFQSDGLHLNAGGINIVTKSIANPLAKWLEGMGFLEP